MPGVGYLLRRNVLHRHGQFLVGILCVELCDMDKKQNLISELTGDPFSGCRDFGNTAENEECE
jgi:hypothetical protein